MTTLTETRIEALRWAAHKRYTPPRTTALTWRWLVRLRLVTRHRGPRTVAGKLGTVYYEATPAGQVVLAAFDLGVRSVPEPHMYRDECGDLDQGP